MQKTKLGMSVNLLAALVCLSPLVGGYVVLFGLALYILLAEKDEWLKKTAVKVLAVVFLFGAANAVLNLVPGVISVIDSIFNLFNRFFEIRFVTRLIYAVENILSFLRSILLIAMSLMALVQKGPEFKPVDDLVEKYTEFSDED